LIREHGRQEAERVKFEARLTGFSSACFANGKEPFPEVEGPKKIVVDNDAAFAGM
jgi:hypothetical protein